MADRPPMTTIRLPLRAFIALGNLDKTYTVSFHLH